MKRENIVQAKKCLNILKNNGFRAPFNILSDNFIIKAVNKLKIRPSMFHEIFKSEPKFFITKCSYEIHKPILVEKDFSGSSEIIKCGHEKPDSECTYTFIKRKQSLYNYLKIEEE